ncbi:MAG: hypothetical protein JO069_18570 [Verrucomicrobia bacterium]|nr:hypothetical protein [Verrucomicrobiota bacterium]
MNLKTIILSVLSSTTCFTAGQAEQQPPPSRGGLLGMELANAQNNTDFFRFFHLEPVGSAESNGEYTITTFRPSGPRFHDLVRLQVETDADNRIVRLTLEVDRSFIANPSTGVFAADLVKSFLFAAGTAADSEALRSLGNEIQFRKVGRQIVIHRDASPQLPSSPSDGYLAYQGQLQRWTSSTSHLSVTLSNVDREGKPVLLLEARPV